MTETSEIERRLRQIEGRQLAFNSVLTALLCVRFQNHPEQAAKELAAHGRAIERIYAETAMTDRGAEVMQVAQHTLERLYEGLA